MAPFKDQMQALEGRESEVSRKGEWSLYGWIGSDGSFDSVQLQFGSLWWPMLGEEKPGPGLEEDYRSELPENAREYLFLRSLMRQTSVHRLFCFSDGRDKLTHSHYLFRRNSRRSKIIPAFEDYCRQVGFACVDDLDAPVVRVPDYVSSGPVSAAIGSVDD